MAGKVERHLLRGLEVELVRPELPVVRVLQRVAGLDAEQRLVRVRVGGVEVVDVAGRDERQATLRGEARQRLEDRPLDVEARVLQLDVRVVAPEDLLEPVELHLRVAHPRLGDRLRDSPREAAGERDQAGRVPLEQLPVDARPVVVALEIAERAELDQVGVARVRLGEQRQVGGALVLCLAVVDDVDLAAEHRLHALGPRRLVQVDRSREGAVVRERHGRHLEPGRLLRERRDPARTVEDRELGVNVQVDVRGAHREGHRTARAGRCPFERIGTPSTGDGAAEGRGLATCDTM